MRIYNLGQEVIKLQQEVLHLNYNEFNELESYEFDEPEEISTVIEGFFQPEDIEKNMAIKKLNFTLCIMLIVLIAITTVSYYFASANEMTLNDLSKETMIYNYENTDLENKLDKLKSFNNVDTSMQKNNILTKAKQVIEVPEVNSTTSVNNNTVDSKKIFNWSVGY